MMSWFRSVVSAICYSIVGSEPFPVKLSGRSVNNVVTFVEGQISRSPFHLRVPLIVATIGIDVIGIFFGGKLLHFYDSESRSKVIDRIGGLPIQPLKEVFKFYQSLALLIAWDEFERGSSVK